MSEMTVPLEPLDDGRWGSPSPAWDHLIQRESSGIPDIIQQIIDVNSGGNEAEGLFQITPRTWRAHGGEDFAPSARTATPLQQAIIAARIFTSNPSGGDWGAGRPGREDASELAAGLVPTDSTGGAPMPAPTEDPRLAALAAVKPDFNEYPNWSNNTQDRAGTTVDLFLLHTEEGDMNADDLVKWMANNGVSYHYAGSEDPNDHGVTIVDMVDTDQASWSVMNSNDRAINFCFAGSYTAWSRDDWLNKAGKVIEAAAYLAVADGIKYGFGANVIAAPYADPPGIADHNYCSVYLRDGNNHSDVGPNFPWDVFKQRVAYYSAAANAQPQPEPPAAPDPHPNPTPAPTPYDPTQNAVGEILIQTRGRFAMLGDQTLIEVLAELRDKLTGSTDAGKSGFRWDK
jgi:N-acetyl-anhydromuramyl-L-alanine amidase AmpD